MSGERNLLDELLALPFTDVASLVLAWGENVSSEDLELEGWTAADDQDWKWVRSGLEAIEERHTIDAEEGA